MNILVTGGAGYIDSHTCVALLEAGYSVIIADNLCNSKIYTIDKIKNIANENLVFYQVDVSDSLAVETIFSNHRIDGVIHFAGFKAVGESYVTQVAKEKREKLRVFGNNYPTVDGTGVRDYIHVLDLAEGHVAALNHLTEGVHIYNLGTGKGTSVLELVHAFEEANDMKVPYVIVDPRPGDIASCYADASKVERELGWTAKRDLHSMCRDAWNFEKNYKQ